MAAVNYEPLRAQPRPWQESPRIGVRVAWGTARLALASLCHCGHRARWTQVPRGAAYDLGGSARARDRGACGSRGRVAPALYRVRGRCDTSGPCLREYRLRRRPTCLRAGASVAPGLWRTRARAVAPAKVRAIVNGPTRPTMRDRRQPVSARWLGYALLAGVVAAWAWRAYRDRSTLDLGLLYQGGRWRGRPATPSTS